MKQEEKQLLLKDLCARLPYKCKYKASKEITHWYKLTLNTETIDKIIDDYYDEIKPYLRPMSSMTEEEKKAFDKFVCIDEFAWNGDTEKGYPNQASIMSDGIDWLLEHHFDFRGLIEKGLALEAPEDMYKEN